MKDAIYLIIIFLLFAYVQNKDIEEQLYKEELEKVMAKCFSDSTGRPVIIGNEIYLCGIYRTGESL